MLGIGTSISTAYAGSVLDHGPDCERWIRKGTRVVAQPVLRVNGDIHLAGLSPVATGGYAERMLLLESALRKNYDQARPAQRSSACINTVLTAFSCKYGG